MAGKTAILIGATGLIGGHCLRMLLESPYYKKVIAVSRRSVGIKHPKLKSIETSFDHLETALQGVKADDAYCCLGTTIKQAGTKAEFHKVDHSYALGFAHRMRQNGTSHFLLVSALGARANSLVFYSRVKGLLEKDIQTLGYPRLSIFRPSLLVGQRAEQRAGEALGLRFSAMLDPFLRGPLQRVHSVSGQDVAAAMITCAQTQSSAPVSIYRYADMQSLLHGNH